jgi:acyl-coenzyme A thioesterase PaaI-like protein
MTNWPQLTINVDRDYSMCFGCGENNPIGLKLKFQQDGKNARAEITPPEIYQGWPGLVHGGILMCILDEAMGWVVMLQGINCVTAEMQVKLKRPVPVNETLIINSSITKKTRKLYKSKANISLKDGTLIAEGTATQFVIDTPNFVIDSQNNKE